MDRRALTPIAWLALGLSVVGCAPQPAPRRCVAPEGLGRPTTVAQAVSLVQALPDPVDPACFVEALDRPLEVVATDSIVSAQPADGADRPRLFLFLDALVVSVVPSGEGAPLVEFGERTEGVASIKAEVALPLEADFTLSDAYDRVQFDPTRSNCGLCHRNEVQVDTLDGVPVYASDALRPFDDTLIALPEVRSAREACDDEDPDCDVLRALLDHGEVLAGAFDDALPVIE